MLGDKSNNFGSFLLLFSVGLSADGSCRLVRFELEHHEFIVYLELFNRFELLLKLFVFLYESLLLDFVDIWQFLQRKTFLFH